MKPTPVSLAWVVLGVGALLGCSSVESTKLPGGAYRIQCEKGMADCVGRAEKICFGKGYTILGGSNATHRVGGASSSYQDVVYVGQLEVVCGAVKLAEPACAPGTAAGATAAPASEPSAPSTSPAPRLCIPGASQGCVGPGGCQGGQSCLADGSGYAACDCGGASPSSSLPSVPGSAPAAEPLAAPSSAAVRAP